ncbi:hypothetical protein FB472_1042 [Rhodoglobus vestalii]|uniref:Uncharacterized protein n=1 Tax=Rhodoglobus vestalii TaxID=193384 RepID=A0A8H2K3K8_9MICO|nr:hypothetical protein [Rhodoglobus vestalii]TQO19485.1 hypothetical protein FB472_1042 [Rhodoglobus vestalii]
MDQVGVLAVSIPFTIASYGAIWYFLTAGPNLAEKLENRSDRVLIKLRFAAVEKLKALRVLLDDVFRDYDAGEDRYLTRARPEIALATIRDYNRLAVLQTAVALASDNVRVRMHRVMWLVVPFALAMTAASVLGAISKTLGSTNLAVYALLAAGATLVIGLFGLGWVAQPYWKVGQAEVIASHEVKSSPAVATALEALNGDPGA